MSPDLLFFFVLSVALAVTQGVAFVVYFREWAADQERRRIALAVRQSRLNQRKEQP